MKKFILLFFATFLAVAAHSQQRQRYIVLWHGYENLTGQNREIPDLNNIFLTTIRLLDAENRYFSFRPTYLDRGVSSQADLALDGKLTKGDNGWRITTNLYFRKTDPLGDPCDDMVSPELFADRVRGHARARYDDLIALLATNGLISSNTSTSHTQQTSPPAEPTPPPRDILYADKFSVYRKGYGSLSEGSVRDLLAGTSAYNLYNNGLRQRSLRSTLCWTGGYVGGLAGILCFIDEKVDWLDYTAAAGLVTVVVGIAIDVSGKRNIRKAVSLYNNRPHAHTSPYWQFGIAPGGIELALTF